jgi:gliding motility-associated-like protein
MFIKSLISTLFILLCFFSFTQNVTLPGPVDCNGAAIAGSWIVPCGVSSITVEIYGAGGGAGGGGGGSNGGFFGTRAGGGGGGGAYSTTTITVTASQVFTYSIGAGGCGGSNGADAQNGGPGTAGGNTTFNGTDANSAAVNLLASGGASGNGGSGSNGSPGNGGAGGTASGGTTNSNGSAGLNGSGATGGSGGSGSGPAGGAGGANTNNPGIIYGGGGAGGGNSEGGRGAEGGIIITYNGTVTIPDTPIIASGAATCVSVGSSTITNYDATMTYVFTPAGPNVANGGAINGMIIGTNYTVIASLNNCNSLESAPFSNLTQTAPPTAPTINTTPPTCSSDAISTISNFNAQHTYDFTPTGPIVDGVGTISGMVVGTSYNVEANDGSCSSTASSSFVNASQLTLPSTPIINSTSPTCLQEGSSVISNYNSNNTYIFSPTGPTVNGAGLINGMVTGTIYTVISNDGNCPSISSESFLNQGIAPPPVAPTISSISPTCTLDGISTISNYNVSYTYTFTPAGPTVGTGGLISNMAAGTSYSVISNDGSCNSVASSNFSNGSQLPAPTPVINGNLTYCSGNNTTLTASGGTSYVWTNANNTNFGNTESITVTQGVYSVSVTNTIGCSASTNAVVTEFAVPDPPVIVASPVNCPGDILTLSATVESGNQISWSGPAGFTSNELTVSFSINASQSGIYQANQFSSPTCVSANASLNIEIVNTYSFDDFDFPNVITANNDGINDKLDIEGIYKTCDSYSLFFLNKWGSLVYEHKLGEEPFSGKTLDGNDLPEGTYFYKLEYYSGGEQKNVFKSGFIQLIR